MPDDVCEALATLVKPFACFEFQEWTVTVMSLARVFACWILNVVPSPYAPPFNPGVKLNVTVAAAGGLGWK